MTPIPIHTMLAAVLAERATPTHASPGTTTEALDKIFALITQTQQQVTVYRGQIMAAEAVHPANVDETEKLHQVLGAAQTAAEELLRSGRNLARAVQRLDDYLAAMTPTDAMPPNP